MSSVIAGVIAILAYLVYIFKNKSDRANQTVLQISTKVEDKHLAEKQSEVKAQETELDKEIKDIEDRIKSRQ